MNLDTVNQAFLLVEVPKTPSRSLKEPKTQPLSKEAALEYHQKPSKHFHQFFSTPKPDKELPPPKPPTSHSTLTNHPPPPPPPKHSSASERTFAAAQRRYGPEVYIERISPSESDTKKALVHLAKSGPKTKQVFKSNSKHLFAATLLLALLENSGLFPLGLIMGSVVVNITYGSLQNFQESQSITRESILIPNGSSLEYMNSAASLYSYYFLSIPEPPTTQQHHFPPNNQQQQQQLDQSINPANSG
ncbi:hypothetical protein MJO28_004757 [Puccinia striiformis f. sp. tritici]|uniref:Uncharacterized protein n=1 Tax=Puccinia striiformis f. sp. tritici TaxID=168172 RepID=A0ACC0EK12_9BASI|nr:hypothetical protein MJO28_004757 [Puccinia striiformis f. sp. tritici]